MIAELRMVLAWNHEGYRLTVSKIPVFLRAIASGCRHRCLPVSWTAESPRAACLPLCYADSEETIVLPHLGDPYFHRRTGAPMPRRTT